MQFTPVKDFYSEETRSQYVTGLSYFCKDDADHAKLKALLPKWVADGKVRLGPATAKEIERHLPNTEKQTITAADVGDVGAVLGPGGQHVAQVSGKGDVR